jgi:hypothetical protein
MASELQLGQLYLWKPGIHHYSSGQKNPSMVVLVLSSQKVKPIYTQYNLLILENNQSHKAIIDKFGLAKFLEDFTEVTDEAQLEQARKQAGK